MTIQEYLLLLRRRWWLLLSGGAVGIALALGFTAVTPKTYVAGTTVIVTATSAEGIASSADLQRVATLAGLAGTDAILLPAAQSLGEDVDEVRASVSARARTGTTLIDVSSIAGTAEEAARRANAVTDTLVNTAPSASGSGSTISLQAVTRAEPPQAPTSPRPKSNIGIGAIIGLALAVGLIVVAEALDTRIRSTADLPMGGRLVGAASLPARRRRLGLLGASKLDSRLEAFRQLRANLLFGGSMEGTIAVSGVSRTSKTIEVGRELARVLAEIGLQVVLVDADFREQPNRDRDASHYKNLPGLAGALTGNCALKDAEVGDAVEGAQFIPAGKEASKVAPLLSTTAMGEVLADLRQRFDFVLITCPPLLERAETSVLAALSDSVLVVVDAGTTRRSDLQQGLGVLSAVGSQAVSVVIDGATWRASMQEEAGGLRA